MNQRILDDLMMIQGSVLLNNSYIIYNSKKSAAVIIDPSFNLNKIIDFLENNKIKKIIILITHYHFDHVGDCYQLLNKFNDCKVYIGKNELVYLNKIYSQNFVALHDKFNSFLNFIEEDEFNISFNGISIKAYATPGHTLGSYTYQYKNVFFTGDFIFYKNIGYLDKKNKGLINFKNSVKKLNELCNDDSIICSGHLDIGKWIDIKKNNIELKEYGDI